jgi:hydroxymethylpyrimidine/phosphomethylpyrimidine kinase
VTAPVALSIAGSDPSGGAGIQADLKTFAAFGVYGAAVIAALTAQSARVVSAVTAVDAGFVARQLEAVLEALPLATVKTGMLYRADVVAVVAGILNARRVGTLVVDPVLRATSGASLIEADAIPVLRERLLPLATLVTPNTDEAAALTRRPVHSVDDMAVAARALVDLGARSALVTGGHLPGDAVDVLCDADGVRDYRAARIGGGSPHGTGCALSAAIAAGLARGRALRDAVADAKDWLGRAIAGASATGTLDFGARPR